MKTSLAVASNVAQVNYFIKVALEISMTLWIIPQRIGAQNISGVWNTRENICLGAWVPCTSRHILRRFFQTEAL